MCFTVPVSCFIQYVHWPFRFKISWKKTFLLFFLFSLPYYWYFIKVELMVGVICLFFLKLLSQSYFPLHCFYAMLFYVFVSVLCKFVSIGYMGCCRWHGFCLVHSQEIWENMYDFFCIFPIVNLWGVIIFYYVSDVWYWFVSLYAFFFSGALEFFLNLYYR